MLKKAFTSGIVIGLIISLISILLYFIDYTLLASMTMGLIMIVLMIALPIIAAVRIKKEQESFNLKEAFLTVFLICVGSILVSTAVNFIMYGLYDPGFGERLAEAAVENQEAMMTRFGLSGEEMDKALEETYNRTKEQYEPGSMLLGVLIGSLISAVFSIIVALIIRKKEQTNNVLDA
ncbi:MAG: DUF4199 domain-containing protein [Flavobacteriales bacterium]|nr:DUF4199 domain-containing protein [Flavobacteriales bacterium]